MSPEERDALAKSRFTTILATRAGGAVAMLLGLWIWLGDPLRQGGLPAVGVPLFVAGFVLSLVVVPILIRRWRTPRP